mgnify:FL=1|tara:strand:+ start:232 stop:381 length:150 start_codon:yes stop_codon:yes gene_type:complete
MNKYYQHSDEYKELHNIFYNGEYYTLKEIVECKELKDKEKIKLIKENLK